MRTSIDLTCVHRYLKSVFFFLFHILKFLYTLRISKTLIMLSNLISGFFSSWWEKIITLILESLFQLCFSVFQNFIYKISSTFSGMEARYKCCQSIHKAFLSSSKLINDPALAGIVAKVRVVLFFFFFVCVCVCVCVGITVNYPPWWHIPFSFAVAGSC